MEKILETYFANTYFWFSIAAIRNKKDEPGDPLHLVGCLHLKTVLGTKWILFLMGCCSLPGWNSLVSLIHTHSLMTPGLWDGPKEKTEPFESQSDEDLANSRKKGNPAKQFDFSLYWLRDKRVGNKIPEQLCVLFKEKLRCIKLA